MANDLSAFVTVVETVYYRPTDSEPIELSSIPGFTKQIKSTEEPYQRRPAIGEDWVRLADGCWVKDAGLLELTNLAWKGLLVQPTEQEKKAIAAKSILVGVKFEGTIVGMFEVPPGESARITCPVDFGSIYIKCLSGSVKCAIAAVPK